jgi:hypothetical protein
MASSHARVAVSFVLWLFLPIGSQVEIVRSSGTVRDASETGYSQATVPRDRKGVTTKCERIFPAVIAGSAIPQRIYLPCSSVMPAEITAMAAQLGLGIAGNQNQSRGGTHRDAWDAEVAVLSQSNDPTNAMSRARSSGESRVSSAAKRANRSVGATASPSRGWRASSRPYAVGGPESSFSPRRSWSPLKA